MKHFLPILKRSYMFAGLHEQDIESMLGCLKATYHTYRKGDYVLSQGDYLDRLLILVEGSLLIQKDDYWGNRHILGHVGIGDLFGEAYAAPQSGALLNDVIATSDSTVVFFDTKHVLTTCSSACGFHAAVIRNLFYAVSQKNRTLVQKIGHLSERTTREKLMSYLSSEAEKHHSSTFSIPFNRQQLADYLSVDRSAMSSELSRMQKEGLLRYEKNHFELV